MIVDITLGHVEHLIKKVTYPSSLSFDDRMRIVRQCFEVEDGYLCFVSFLPKRALDELRGFYQQYHAVHPGAKKRVLLNAMKYVLGETPEVPES